MPESEDVIYCSNCGQQLLATANYCNRCGQTVADDNAAQETVPASGEEGNDGISRRKAIGYGVGGVVVAMAGVSFLMGATSAKHESADGDAWSGSRSTGTTSATVSGTATLGAGEFLARSLSPDVSVQLEIDIDVRSGGPIDAFVMDRSELDNYRNAEDDVLYYNDLSETKVTSTTITGSLPSGDYAFIIDNTGAYGACPDGEAVVDVELTAGL